MAQYLQKKEKEMNYNTIFVLCCIYQDFFVTLQAFLNKEKYANILIIEPLVVIKEIEKRKEP